ncbi:MAG: hypothetical protein U1F27_17060 [Turneriella sp.]
MEIIIAGNLIQRRWKDAEGKTRSNFRAVSVSNIVIDQASPRTPIISASA